jgi:hypothetical protein
MDEGQALPRIRALFAAIQTIGQEHGPADDMMELAALGEAIVTDQLQVLREEE